MTNLLKVLGIAAMVVILYGLMLYNTPFQAWGQNHQNLALRIGTLGILVLGVAPLIISGGIDLSIGSVVAISSVTFALMMEKGIPLPWLDIVGDSVEIHGPTLIQIGIPRVTLLWSGGVIPEVDMVQPLVSRFTLIWVGGAIPPIYAAVLVLCTMPLIGLFHGLLATKLRLQPFLVTLCGLFIYRGLARWLTIEGERGASRAVGIGATEFNVRVLDFLVAETLFGVPWVLYLFFAIAVFVGIFLHGTVYGRYLYAIGANEQAARYAGIQTHRYRILPYMWCSLMAGLAGILEMLEVKTASPGSAGAWYELYAITGAVLGGCSLRGGEGTIIGIFLGATILPLLRNVSFFAGVPDDLKFTVLGVALLLGTILDEALKRRAAARV